MKEIKCYCGHITTCDCSPLEKQSAVEWLEEIYLTIGIDRYVHFNQAKLMEKEHMIGFYKWMLENNTEQNAVKYFHFTDNDMLDEYYNEQYGGNK